MLANAHYSAAKTSSNAEEKPEENNSRRRQPTAADGSRMHLLTMPSGSLPLSRVPLSSGGMLAGQPRCCVRQPGSNIRRSGRTNRRPARTACTAVKRKPAVEGHLAVAGVFARVYQGFGVSQGMGLRPMNAPGSVGAMPSTLQKTIDNMESAQSRKDLRQKYDRHHAQHSPLCFRREVGLSSQVKR